MLRTKKPHENACIWVESRQMTFHTYVLKVYINIQRKINDIIPLILIFQYEWRFGPIKLIWPATFYWKVQKHQYQARKVQGSRWREFGRRSCLVKVDFAFSLVKSRHVILKSRTMSPPAYFLHLSFMKMSISCTCLLKSIVSVIKYFESDFLGK
jgi:hypothetical protein